MNTETGDDLETETNVADEQYVISLMLFLIAYALFEVPSNYYLKLMTPSVRLPPFRAMPSPGRGRR